MNKHFFIKLLSVLFLSLAITSCEKVSKDPYTEEDNMEEKFDFHVDKKKLTGFGPKILLIYLAIYYIPIIADLFVLSYMKVFALSDILRACLSPHFIIGIALFRIFIIALL